jgi:hypothetical protein
MSGSGGSRRDDEVGSIPIGSSGTSGAGGGGAGGTGTDPCAIIQDAPINSPKPIVTTLSVGDVLDVRVTGTAPYRVLEVRTVTGTPVGSLTHRGHIQLIGCIDQGNEYSAEVIQLSGGSVIVRIERK